MNIDLENIRNIHSVETPAACKRLGGLWDNGACFLDEYGDPHVDVGISAPIKGAYLWYEINDFDEGGYPSGSFHGYVAGCLLKRGLDDEFGYPHSPGWCYSFYDKRFPPQDWVGDKVRDHLIEVFRDIAKGKAGKHGLAYFTHDGKKLPYPSLYAYVGDKKGDVFKDAGKYIKSFSFRRRGMHERNR